MSTQITVGTTTRPTEDGRGLVVPVEGTLRGKPFIARVYLGVAHNCCEVDLIRGEWDILSDPDDLIVAAMGHPDYIEATARRPSPPSPCLHKLPPA
jgi:hypothetical protein